MKFDKVISLKEIAQLINAEFVGNPDFPIKGMNEIHVVEEGDIVFVDHPKYYEKALNSAASVIIINDEITKITPLVSKMKSYKLYNYYNSLDIDTCNLQHFGVVQNEMIKRGLIDGEIQSLNDFNTNIGV